MRMDETKVLQPAESRIFRAIKLQLFRSLIHLAASQKPNEAVSFWMFSNSNSPKFPNDSFQTDFLPNFASLTSVLRNFEASQHKHKDKS